ncbi:carbon-monoxide dehydrogenase medium subunit [Rhizobium sp. RU35A]|uniref:FAD binding domain-containing protein n=1 Tax=Rhizobium sp. RU35A TaxID=1907414 RepID=UPI000954256A|nr:FAD binding domain-containing protein [Rhizobium sp. RU35A]SIR39607.1 carbon-monoxide dehydrogenase medium subunit [Rhizobium sp. RU35A]
MDMREGPERVFDSVATVAEAVAAREAGAAVLAGGTWMMRDPRRGVDLPKRIVALSGIAELQAVDVLDDRVSIGASVTHTALAKAVTGVAGLEGLAAAATGAANPAIRRVATVGGNLCTIDFAAADLVPALLALDAEVELALADGPRILPLPDFLRERIALLNGALLTRVVVRRNAVASTHVRLPLRKAGDYPVAIVSVARAADGAIRIAVGSVEPVARRWTALEAAFAGQTLTPEEAQALAEKANDFIGRDGIEVEGWYRRAVLPVLVRRAFAALERGGAA